MKILFVAPWVPCAVRPRSLGLLRILAEENEVMFLGLARHEAEARLADKLPVADVVIVRNHAAGSAGRSVRGLLNGGPLQTAYADVPDLRRQLRRLVAAWSPDIVHLNVFRTAHLLPSLTDTPVVLDLDEFRSAFYTALARSSSPMGWRMVGRLEAPRMTRAEGGLLTSRACLLVSSPSDLRGPNTVLVRSPCDLEPTLGGANDPVILFVGRLHYRPNVEGIRWFWANCWPAIRSRHPRARLRIVGESPTRSVRRLAGRGVEVVGNVQDMQREYGQAMIAVVPVGAGTGIQMKLVQALACALPVVSFPGPLARAGLTPGDGAVSAECASEWVQEVGDLLDDPARRAELAAAGTGWNRAHHHSSHVRRSLLDAYARVGALV